MTQARSYWPRLVRGEGRANVSDEFYLRMSMRLGGLPIKVLSRLGQYGVSVLACKTLTLGRPELVGERPTGHGGYTFAAINGVYLRGERTVCIAEYTNPNGALVLAENSDYVLYHEIGHAWDCALGNASRRTSFDVTHTQGLRYANVYGRTEHLHYFTRISERGVRETFAEAFAVHECRAQQIELSDDVKWFAMVFADAVEYVDNLIKAEANV